jgi:hypothetical protein
MSKNILKLIDDIYFYSCEKLNGILINEEIDPIIDQLITAVIVNILEKDKLDKDDIELLSHVKNYDLSNIQSNDIFGLIQKMSVIARENSHGACILYRVFVTSDAYKQLLESTGQKSVKNITIGKVQIKPCDEVTKDIGVSVYGICKSKFNISPIKLILTGKIGE